MDSFNLPPFQPEPRKRHPSTDQPSSTQNTQQQQQQQAETSHDMPWFTTSASGSTDALFGGQQGGLATVTAPSYGSSYGTEQSSVHGTQGDAQYQYNYGQQQQQAQQQSDTNDYYSYGYPPPSTASAAPFKQPAMGKSGSIPSIQNMMPPWEDNASTRQAVSGEEPEAVLKQQARSGSTSRQSSAASSQGSVNSARSPSIPPALPSLTGSSGHLVPPMPQQQTTILPSFSPSIVSTSHQQSQINSTHHETTYEPYASTTHHEATHQTPQQPYLNPNEQSVQQPYLSPNKQSLSYFGTDEQPQQQYHSPKHQTMQQQSPQYQPQLSTDRQPQLQHRLSTDQKPQYQQLGPNQQQNLPQPQLSPTQQQPLQQQSPQLQQTERFCTRCGTRNTGEANFCCRCGLQLVVSPTFPDFDMSSVTSELQSMNIQSRSPEVDASGYFAVAGTVAAVGITEPDYVPTQDYVPLQDSVPVQEQQQPYSEPLAEEPKCERVHPVMSFGFGGRLVYTIPQRQTRYSAATNSTVDCFRPGFLNIVPVDSKCPNLTSTDNSSLPTGPFNEKTKPKELAKPLSTVKTDNECDAFLLKLLGFGLENNGQVMSAATEKYIKDHFTIKADSLSLPLVDANADSSHAFSLLCNGDVLGAFTELLRVGRLDAAFAISGVVNREAFSNCLTAFYDNLPTGHLVSLLLLFLGIVPVNDQTLSKVSSIDWKTVVAIYGAHHKSPSAKLTLQRLADSHTDKHVSAIYTVLSSGKQVLPVSSELSELYEYCLMLSGQPPLPALQPHKLQAASKCIDNGDIDRAQQYLSMLASSESAHTRRAVELLQDRLEHSPFAINSQKATGQSSTQKAASMWSKFNLADAIVSSVIGADDEQVSGKASKSPVGGEKKPLFTPEKSPISTPNPIVYQPQQKQQPMQQSYQSFYSAYGSESETTASVSSATVPPVPLPPTTTTTTAHHHQVKTTAYGQQHPIETPSYGYGYPTDTDSGYGDNQPLLTAASPQQPQQQRPPQYSPQSYGQSYSSYDTIDQPQQPTANAHQPTISNNPTIDEQPQEDTPASPAPKPKQGGVLSILKSFISSTSSSPPAHSTSTTSTAIGAADKNAPTRANLGEQSKFRYDERLKRWVEEGAEEQAVVSSVPSFPPVPMAPGGGGGGGMGAAVGSADYRGIKKHFDPFNLAAPPASGHAPATGHAQSQEYQQPQQQYQYQQQSQYEETTLF